MKEHEIDQLFRQKLHQHRVAPTPAAWNKVATELNSRRRKRGGYYAAAAAAILLLSAGWLWLTQQTGPLELHQSNTLAVQEPRPARDNSNTQTAAHAVAPELSVKAGKASPATPATDPATQQTAAETSKPKMANQLLQPKQAVKPTKAALPETTTETALSNAVPQLSSLEPTPLEIRPIAIEPPPIRELPTHTEQIVIRYNASMSYTIAAEETTIAAEEADKGAEKVWSILQKVKQGEIGLADIRQAKDKLLSGRLNKP